MQKLGRKKKKKWGHFFRADYKMAALNISPRFLEKQADVVWCTSLSDPCHSLSDSTILLTACSYVFLNEVKGINDTTALLAVEGSPRRT